MLWKTPELATHPTKPLQSSTKIVTRSLQTVRSGLTRGIASASRKNTPLKLPAHIAD
jgi:hypothetical protein